MTIARAIRTAAMAGNNKGFTFHRVQADSQANEQKEEGVRQVSSLFPETVQSFPGGFRHGVRSVAPTDQAGGYYRKHS